MARKPLGGLGRPVNLAPAARACLARIIDRLLCCFTWGTRNNKTRVFNSCQSTIHWVTPLTGITVVGVLVHVTKHERSIHFSRQFMRPHHSLALRSWGPRSHNKTHVFDSGHSTTHGVTPPTGVMVVASPYTEHNTNVRFRSFDDP